MSIWISPSLLRRYLPHVAHPNIWTNASKHLDRSSKHLDQFVQTFGPIIQTFGWLVLVVVADHKLQLVVAAVLHHVAAVVVEIRQDVEMFVNRICFARRLDAGLRCNNSPAELLPVSAVPCSSLTVPRVLDDAAVSVF